MSYPPPPPFPEPGPAHQAPTRSGDEHDGDPGDHLQDRCTGQAGSNLALVALLVSYIYGGLIILACVGAFAFNAYRGTV
jgi:hypothetical protein